MISIARIRFVFALVSVAANAVTAGGIFTFPLMAPALATSLHLTQPQLTTVVLAGVAGQYPASALVGYIIDKFGPHMCSLIAAILFGTGFGLFSWTVSSVALLSADTAFRLLTVLFLLCGLATVNSYFSALFTATRAFPHHPGLAAGVSMGLFGLSPLILSFIAGSLFKTPGEGLDIAGYTCFLASLTFIVHLLGVITLRNPGFAPEEASPRESHEEDPLLPAQDSSSRDVKQSVRDVLLDSSFWMLAIAVGITLGSCEMVISNIGSIVMSLPSSLSPTSTSLVFYPMSSSPVVVTAGQIRLFSASNTLSRIAVGSIADWVSPVGVPGLLARRKHMSRISFLSAFAILLALVYSYLVLGVRKQEQLWPLSVSVGASYGAIFTIVPSIVSAFWGSSNVGRNFGLITYAPFCFTPAFSYLYAFLSDANVPNVPEGGPPSVCRGVKCWQTTFTISAISCCIAVVSTLRLWGKWKECV